ncbi:MAG: Na+/H+ antiporter [Chloroflexota bacterium]
MQIDPETLSPILQVEEIIIGLLLIASLVAIAASRLRIPYTVGLVLIGLALTIVPRQDIDSQDISTIIMALLVPPLVFEAAFHLRMDDLRRDLGFILLLAVPGVILTTLLVGGVVAWGAGIALPSALVFGALIAATDPVAVVALFRRLGAPKRLQVLLEGESLFNDGTAIVMFGLMVAIAETGHFSLAQSLTEFLRVAGGGALVGLVLGMLISQLIGRIDDPLVETTLTTVLAFGAYISAELLHFSGVLAVVAAGILNGNVGPRGMSATTRLVVFNFWEYFAFLANSLIFLVIGLVIDTQLLFENWEAIGVAILAVLGARAISVYGFSFFGKNINWKWRHVVYWGGLRGAISLALTLTIPAAIAGAEGLKAMAFGVVLFTLLVQGFSMDWLSRKLKLVERTHMQEEYERRHARFVAARSGYEYLQRLSRQGLISEHTWQRLSKILERQNAILVDAVRDVITSDPAVEAEELDTARREALRAQRTALTGLLRDGVISEETYSQLVGEVDAALTEQGLTWPELLQAGNSTRLPVDQMMAAVIQEPDLENALSALNKIGLTVIHLPSSGGFLSRRNVTLLIGLPEGREQAAVQALQRSCRKRVEYLSEPFRESHLPLAAPIPVTIGGATIFTFEVEAYEEF